MGRIELEADRRICRVLMQKLATKTKAFDQVAIALRVTFFQIVQQAATLIHHAQQTPPRVFSTFDLTAPPDKGEVWGLGVVVHDRDDVNGAPIESKTWPSGIDSTKPATWGEMAFGETEQMISGSTSTTPCS